MFEEYKDGKYTIREYSNGNKEWYLNGKYHREDGPAIENSDGNKLWYLNGKLHRENGPAIECSNGNKHWFLNGMLHRENGPAIECSNEYREWYLNGKKIFYFEYKTLYEDWIEIPDLNYIGPFKRISDVFIELPIEIKKNKYIISKI